MKEYSTENKAEQATAMDAPTVDVALHADKKNTLATPDAASQITDQNNHGNNNTMADDKQIRIDGTEKFFNLLFGKVAETKFCYLWVKRGETKQTIPFDVSTSESRRAMAQKAIEFSDSGFDVYFGVNLMDKKPDIHSRVTSEFVSLQTATVTDIDIFGGKHTDPNKYPATFEDAKSFLPFETSITVSSGYGLHAYCLYSKPITITDENRAACIERNKNFISTVRSRAGVFACAADGVHDLPRVLRVPGTYNYKCGRENAPLCHVVDVNPIRFSPAELDEKLNALSVAEQSITTPSRNHQRDFIDDKDFNLFRAKRMLDFINPASLTYDEWLAVGMALKNIGCDCSDWENWSRSDDRFKDGECESKWNGFNRDGYDIGTIFMFAQPNGYDAKEIYHEWQELNPSLPPSAKINIDEEPQRELNTFPQPVDKISLWQQENGDIEPKLLAKLKTQAERIQAVSDFAQAASDTTTQKYLGAFKYYSFFDHIRQKFFADLKQRKEDAKNKIKKYHSLKRTEELDIALKGDKVRDEIAACKPSDAELALIDVDVTSIKNKVNTYETAAKKAHRQYLEQKEIDAFNAKYNAERKAYEEEPPSTKRNIPDCPIDLILPLGIYFDNSKGIRIVDFDKPVGRTGRPIIEACQNLVVPIRAFREVTKRGENPKSKDQYEIAIKTANHWRRVIVDARTLQDARAVSALTDFGAHITEPRMMAKYFAKIISLNEKNERLKVTRVYLQPGWQDRNFEFFAYPTGGDDYIVKNGDFDYNNIFTPYGDKDAWKHMLHRVIFHDPKNYSKDKKQISDKPNVVAAMVLGSTFGAPLIAPLGIRNQQLVLGFDSGNGKTAAAKFATSFFGNPDALCPTCNATENFLEDLSVKLNDLPQGVDELQSAKKYVRENMDELVYKFSGGTTRGRADIQGNAKPTFHYRGFRVFTGEQTIINNSSGQGAISRVFEITKPELFADSFGIELHNFTQDHFGFFGKHYTTEFIPHNLARIRRQFSMWRDVFTSDTSNLLSSHATFLAYAFTGLQFGLEATGYSEDEALKITFDVVNDSQFLIDDAPNKASAKNVNRALPDIIEYLDARPTQLIHEIHTSNADEFVSAESNQPTLGVKLLNGNYAITPSTLKNIINDLGYPSAKAIIRALGENNYLDCGESKSQKYKKRLPEHFTRWFGRPVWFYIIKVPKDSDSSIAA